MIPPEDNTSPGDFVPPSPEQVDALLPDYDILEFIAQGGMGAIYKGVQTRLDRPVAIKILPKVHGFELDYASRFELEAKAMAKLSHNNIVGVYDYGESGDGAFLYFIMEYVEGSDLFHLLRDGKINSSNALPVLKQICDALRYAHTNGIVHRDIKPANILIDSSGNVRIADFGLAKSQHTGDDEDEAAFGTPDYVAPETLVEGVAVDHRADIYSLGVVIYECLTGKIPRGEFDVPSVVNPDIDRRFDEIVTSAMAIDRDERWADVASIQKILVDIEKTPRLVAARPGATGRVPTLATARVPAIPTVPTVPTGTPRAPGSASLRSRPVPKSSSSGVGAALVILFTLLAAAGGGYYWFVLRPPAGPALSTRTETPETATGDSGESFFKPGPGAIPNPVEPEPSPPAEVPAASTTPETAPEIIEPTPEPIVPIPNAGRLRAFGSMREGDVNIDKAAEFDDVVTIRARDANWHALRANGETVASSSRESGIKDVTWLEARKFFHRVVRANGTVWANKEEQFFPGEITNAVKAVGHVDHHEVLLADGTLAVWGDWYGSADRLCDPPMNFSDLVDISATPNWTAAVDRDGNAYFWNRGLNVTTRKPRSDDDQIVDVEPTGYSFLGLTRSGRVVVWHGNQDVSSQALPKNHVNQFFIKIRGGQGIRAAQKADGTWAAWGDRSWGVLDKIRSLPPTPDIAMAVYEDYGFLYWIEPNPEYMPLADGSTPSHTTSPTAPTFDNPRVAEIFEKVKTRHNRMVLNPYHEELARLNSLYLSALERGEAAARQEGDSLTAKAITEELAACREALTAADNGKTPPPLLVASKEDAAPASPSLRTLRATYRTQNAKFLEQRDLNAQAVLNTYLSELKLLETEIKNSQGTAAAEKIRAIHDRVESQGVEALNSP